ncbi:Single-stranded DNA-binding protein [Clostridiaceae bacterium JG1575]|nr:Single-stranded DNA-binding protein [Clostridiaceae bacterium JG1575]
MEKHLNTNDIQLCGVVVTDPLFSHEMVGERFSQFTMRVCRLSDQCDVIPVTVSEHLLDRYAVQKGALISVQGSLRSYNKYLSGRNKLILTVFARVLEAPTTDFEDPNRIELEGYVCKKPVFRTTPFGREIADLLLAVNRSFGKSDYIPVIAWGRNARLAKDLQVGDCLSLIGRFQSRAYQKTKEEGTPITCTAYEVSLSKIEQVQRLNAPHKKGARAVSLSFHPTVEPPRRSASPTL